MGLSRVDGVGLPESGALGMVARDVACYSPTGYGEGVAPPARPDTLSTFTFQNPALKRDVKIGELLDSGWLWCCC